MDPFENPPALKPVLDINMIMLEAREKKERLAQEEAARTEKYEDTDLTCVHCHGIITHYFIKRHKAFDMNTPIGGHYKIPSWYESQGHHCRRCGLRYQLVTPPSPRI